MEGKLLLLSAGLVAMSAIFLLRYAWAQQKRSLMLNSLAWALMALGLVLGGWHAGAWGISVTVLVATGCAFVVLGHAAFTASSRETRLKERQVDATQVDAKPLYIGRRITTFLLSVPAGLIASIIIAVGCRAFASITGWQEADSNVLALFMMPLIWAVLVFLMLMKTDRRRQILVLAVPTMTGGAFLILEAVL